MVKYFTDGAASQYKNFANLAHHFADFNLRAMAHRKSLQSINNSDSDIQTARALFEFANTQSFFLCRLKSEEVKMNEEQLLNNRFENAKTVPGTKSFHKFVLVDTHTIEAFELSNSVEQKSFVVMRRTPTVELIDFKDLRVQFVTACVYDGEWYLGTITEKINEEFEVNVHFFHA